MTTLPPVPRSTDAGAEAPTESVELELWVPTSEVVFVTAMLDSYEGLCSCTTPEPDSPRLVLQVAPGQLDELLRVLEGIELVEGRIDVRTLRSRYAAG
jgi:uncharacterized protein DUF4911